MIGASVIRAAVPASTWPRSLPQSVNSLPANSFEALKGNVVDEKVIDEKVIELDEGTIRTELAYGWSDLKVLTAMIDPGVDKG